VAPSIVLIQLLTMLLFTAASFGFIRRSKTTGDELMRWLAAGTLLAAFSRLHYALFPSLYSDWVYTGDFLRVGFYTLILIGAADEIRRYWNGLASAAAAEERRRIARDLHDGLAQELAYIAVQSRWLANHGDDHQTLRNVGAAADRALDESRRAIAALTRADDEPLDVALAQAAEEVADRVNTTVRLDLQEVPPVDADAQEALLRIAREAIANAGRHSGADEVVVRLSSDDCVRLQVTDEGVGFDPATLIHDRFGLISMRERAEALNAELLVTSSPGRGTSVEVALP
jgi:signal transduction histidine kinase